MESQPEATTGIDAEDTAEHIFDEAFETPEEAVFADPGDPDGDGAEQTDADDEDSEVDWMSFFIGAFIGYFACLALMVVVGIVDAIFERVGSAIKRRLLNRGVRSHGD